MTITLDDNTTPPIEIDGRPYDRPQYENQNEGLATRRRALVFHLMEMTVWTVCLIVTFIYGHHGRSACVDQRNFGYYTVCMIVYMLFLSVYHVVMTLRQLRCNPLSRNPLRAERTHRQYDNIPQPHIMRAVVREINTLEVDEADRKAMLDYCHADDVSNQAFDKSQFIRGILSFRNKCHAGSEPMEKDNVISCCSLKSIGTSKKPRELVVTGVFDGVSVLSLIFFVYNAIESTLTQDMKQVDCRNGIIVGWVVVVVAIFNVGFVIYYRVKYYSRGCMSPFTEGGDITNVH